MGLQGTLTNQIFERAKAVIPHGVNSNFRYWGDTDTLVLSGGEGGTVQDVDGKRYIDYRLGFGPVILGHAYPAVIERVRESLQDGNIFAMTTMHEVVLCEQIARMCPVDKVRLTNTGSEATMHALRLARAFTGREKYIKFEGTYHGMVDYFMYSSSFTPVQTLGSRRSPIPVPTTSGLPRVLGEYIYTVPFNDEERLEETVRVHWQELAAIFVEPIVGNMSSMMPRPGFLSKIRELCDRYGILMVMDEVKTGFRVANGGAQSYFDIQADLVTYAKALGNGFPIAAFAGKESVMMTIQPGEVAHGGTYSANVVGVTAATATLEVLENEPVSQTLYARGKVLMDGIDEVLNRSGIAHCMTGLPPMFGFVLGTDQEPADYREYMKQADLKMYERLFAELVPRGVIIDPAGQEPIYLCYSHGSAQIDQTLNAFEDAVKTLK